MLSFRWRLALGFALTVVLAVGLMGLFAALGTRQRFGILTSEAGRARAEALAPVLGAEYAYWGSWRSVAQQRFNRQTEPQAPPANLFNQNTNQQIDLTPQPASPPARPMLNTMQQGAPLWQQNAMRNNWGALIIQAFNLEVREVLDHIRPGQSLYDVFVTEGKNIREITQYIVRLETLNINESVRAGDISADAAEVYLQTLPAQVEAFLKNVRVQRAGRRFELVVPPQLTMEGVNWLLESLLFGKERLLVANVEGRVMLDSEQEMAGQTLNPPALKAGTPIYNPLDGEQVGTVLVGAELGLYDVQQRAFLQGVQLTVALSAVAGGLAALVVGLVIARQVTRPVTDLTRAAERIASGDLEQQVPVRSDDELGQMTQAFNRMAGEIATQHMLRRRLVDDLAHELNTPLSLMQLEIQAMEDGLQPPDEAASQLRRELVELHALVADLSYLADADSTPSLNLSKVDINDLVEEIAMRFTAQAEACEVALHVRLCEAPLTLLLDQVRIGQALTNLLHNALRHTRAGGQIEVTAMCKEGTAGIVVRDTGEGIPPEDLPHIWERFYRSDRSRSRDTGGRGLGLSIVRQAVEMHGGRVWVRSAPGEGSAFGLALPISPPQSLGGIAQKSGAVL